MTLLDHFRPRRIPWEDPDPNVRAEAVRQIGSEEQELFGRLAQEDPDARVRRAAVRKLTTVEALVRCVADADADVRDTVIAALLHHAHAEDETRAAAALAALADARSLATLARSAPLASVRRSALARLSEPRALAAVAKIATHPDIRLSALARVDDPSLIAEVAAKSEHKDVAVAAVERLDDLDALAHVAERGRNRAAARRAAARRDALTPPVPTPEDAPAVSPAEDAPVEALEAAVEAPPNDQAATPTAVTRTEPAPEAADQTPEPVVASEPEATPMPDVPETVETSPSSGAPVEPPLPAPGHAVTAPSAAASAAADERRKREQERKETLARVEGLCARLEGLQKAETPALRGAEAALREARTAQDQLGLLPPKLRQRFKTARAGLFARTQELREADEWSRWSNAVIQEGLCARMEALVAVTDLEKAARELHDCDARWAEARYAPREEAEALRQRYQAARALVKVKLDAYFAKKSAEEAENLKLKDALCVRAEALTDSTDWLKAAEQLKALQAEWKKVGPAPRRQAEAIWKRFRTACDRFFTRREADLRQRKQEWSANLAKKEALCARAEAAAGSTDWDATASLIRSLQAEWKTIGPVQRKRSEDIWQRFRKACDAFFDRYKRRDEVEVERKRVEREAICAELEGLLPSPEGGAPPAPADLLARVQALQARAREHVLPPPLEDALGRRFAEARTRLVTAFAEAFRGSDLDPEANRAKKERLCRKVEGFVAAAGTPTAALSGDDLARRLKEALASNTIGGAAEAENKRRAEEEEVKAAQAAWRRLGPVPGEAGTDLEQRFRSACDRFFAQRKPSRPSRPAAVR